MMYRRVFLGEIEAWEFAKKVVRLGGIVIDYGKTFGGYYIKYKYDGEEIE